jgi:hypothetical protein
VPFRCEWKVEGRVLYAYLGSELTLEEIAALSRTSIDRIAQDGEPPIYYLIDMSALRRAPLPISQLRRVIGDEQSENIGCYIVIVTSPIFGFVSAAFVKLLRRPIRIVSTFEEALAALESFDPELAARIDV